MHDGMEKEPLVISRKQHILICALAGLLILGGVLGLSAHRDLQNAEKQFEDTISYVKEQCTGYDNLNLASETKSLMRVMENVQHLCSDIERERELDDVAVAQYLRSYTITGALLLTPEGKVECSASTDDPLTASLCFRQRAKYCAGPPGMAGRLTRRSGHRWKRNWPVLSC